MYIHDFWNNIFDFSFWNSLYYCCLIKSNRRNSSISIKHSKSALDNLKKKIKSSKNFRAPGIVEVLDKKKTINIRIWVPLPGPKTCASIRFFPKSAFFLTMNVRRSYFLFRQWYCMLDGIGRGQQLVCLDTQHIPCCIREKSPKSPPKKLSIWWNNSLSELTKLTKPF